MTNQRSWKYWIGDHPDFYPLPANLAMALRHHDLDRELLVPLSPPHFYLALDEIDSSVAGSVLAYGPPAYHNKAHFRRVVANTALLLDASDERAPEVVGQAMMFAALGHDFGHQGSTFRKDAPRGKPLIELGDNIATEEVSAILMDRLAREIGLSVGMRVFIARLIHATTFGNPAIVPQTPLEKLLCCADVAPNRSFKDWLKQGIAVMYGEVPSKPAPVTFSGWIDDQLRFISHHLMNFVNPDKPQYVAAAVKLGWHEVIASHRARLESVKNGAADPALVAMMKSLLPASVDPNA